MAARAGIPIRRWLPFLLVTLIACTSNISPAGGDDHSAAGELDPALDGPIPLGRDHRQARPRSAPTPRTGATSSRGERREADPDRRGPRRERDVDERRLRLFTPDRAHRPGRQRAAGVPRRGRRDDRQGPLRVRRRIDREQRRGAVVRPFDRQGQRARPPADGVVRSHRRDDRDNGLPGRRLERDVARNRRCGRRPTARTSRRWRRCRRVCAIRRSRPSAATSSSRAASSRTAPRPRASPWSTPRAVTSARLPSSPNRSGMRWRSHPAASSTSPADATT